MDRCNSETYESMLCEDRDTEDKWWFLRGLESELTSHGVGRVCGGVPELISVSPVTVIDTKKHCVESSAELPPPMLRETEIAMLDSFCAKYGGTPQFRADLIKLMLLLVSVQDVTGVNGHVGISEVTDGF
ncbi:hypothetical protein KC19_VG320100 [Ceratodon purpureus]|uniref:Uncharacterized protein n=1 Tax=Ceratodon purpureus TaxID=3225 RepID=A0A8T0HW99_CERPU|nr:hypothetical protein KC19_VG320100 [Ceratodon purpureus]